MSFKYINLAGNDLLIVLFKLLKKQNINLAEFFDSQFNILIEDNFGQFLTKVEQKGFEFPEFSGLKNYFEELKDSFLEAQIKGKKFEIK